jgi:hypothetical protein
MNINFEYNTEYGLFSDSLWFPDGDPLPSPEEINAMEQERLNNWLAIVTPTPMLGPTETQPV